MNRFQAHRARLKREHALRVEAFAQLLADGLSPTEAATSMGMSNQNTGYKYLAEIKRDLGWQAS